MSLCVDSIVRESERAARAPGCERWGGGINYFKSLCRFHVQDLTATALDAATALVNQHLSQSLAALFSSAAAKA
eukprot:15880-Heterococcus_DN1.PRE.2